MRAKYTVAYADHIGQRRVGWCVYNSKDFEFLTDKQILNLISSGRPVLGMTVYLDGELTIDETYTTFMMVKSGTNFTHKLADDMEYCLNMINKYYALTAVIKHGKNIVYRFVTNHCGVEDLNESQVKALLQLTDMGGVKFDSRNRLKVHADVNVIEIDESGDCEMESDDTKSE